MRFGFKELTINHYRFITCKGKNKCSVNAVLKPLSLFVVHIDGVRLSLYTVASNGPIVHTPDDMWARRVIVEWHWQAKTDELGEKPLPVALCPPQILHGLNDREPRPPQWEAGYALSKVRRCLRHNLCSQPYGSKSLVRSTGSAVWNF
jgi:hypothetical protein